MSSSDGRRLRGKDPGTCAADGFDWEAVLLVMHTESHAALSTTPSRHKILSCGNFALLCVRDVEVA